MTDPWEQQVRDAMHTGAARLTPGGAMGETRSRLLEGVRRRQRQVLTLTVAALLLISAGVAVTVSRAPRPSSRQIVAVGAGRAGASTSTTGSAAIGSTAGVGGVAPGTGATASNTGPVPSITPATTGRPATTVPATAVTTTPPTTPATSVYPTTTRPGVSIVQGTVRFSPTCPVEQFPPNPACAPRPGAAHIQLVRADGSVAAAGDAGTSGDFAIPVAPGTYTVEAAAIAANTSIGRGCTVTPAQVTVARGTTVTVAVSCDTGIR